MSWSTLNHSLHRLNKDQIRNVPFTNLTWSRQQAPQMANRHWFRFSWAFFPCFFPRFSHVWSRCRKGPPKFPRAPRVAAVAAAERLRGFGRFHHRPGRGPVGILDIWDIWDFMGTYMGTNMIWKKHGRNLPNFSISPNYMTFLFRETYGETYWKIVWETRLMTFLGKHTLRL